MRNLFLLSLLLFFGAVVWGQNKVEFAYDAAGNRTSRQIVALKSAFVTDTIAIGEELIGEKSIKLYPNPTFGLLTMAISHFEAGETATIHVADLQGRAILNEQQSSPNFKIDLSTHPQGIYILSVTIGNQRKEWKVVKQ